jgi:hypothetical protein
VLGDLSARPISGPRINGARQYFYRRSDIANSEDQAEFSQAFLGRLAESPRSCIAWQRKTTELGECRGIERRPQVLKEAHD